MGIIIKEGRDFSKDYGQDSSAVIINEVTAKYLGYANPIGEKLYKIDTDNPGKTIAFTIIGVVKNFNYESLRQDIGPLCLYLNKSYGLASFRISGSNAANIIKQVEAKWKNLASGMPFSYRFLDESFDEMYHAEQRVGKIALIFSSLAILIACLGLFGLATFIAEQRTKEIGIRKVLGASVQGIVQMLSKDFAMLVVIAFIIAVPAGWYIMHKWLESFVYRVNLSFWIFIVAGTTAMFIALITVSFQAIKAALNNPVKSLRSE
jgi:putative ABC transport system permease protein